MRNDSNLDGLAEIESKWVITGGLGRIDASDPSQAADTQPALLASGSGNRGTALDIK